MLIENLQAFEAFCFDLDGTLVDTEVLKQKAYEKAIGALLGVDVRACDAGWMGRPEPEVVAYMMKWAKHDVNADKTTEIIAHKRSLYEQMIEAGVATMHCADALLAHLKNSGAKLALVTSSPKRHVDPILKHCGWENMFHTIVARDDVVDAKPDPEGYQLAVQRLGKVASSCVAVEDSMSGFHAALATDMPCILVGDFDAKAYMSCSNLGELLTSG